MRIQIPFLGLFLLVACGGVSDASLSSNSDSRSTGSALSAHAGMGANVYSGGVAFRVWAPNADAVAVSGEFNGWSETPLGAEGNGNWSADVDGAVAGQQYRFVISKNGAKQSKPDPRARQMTNSVGNSVIVDPSAYAWNATDFRTPGWQDQVIYELHVGTFNGYRSGHPGQFSDASAKLDYLASLGVNMIELMPLGEFAGDFSWGYNPAYPDAPESAYGSPDDVRAFIDGAHARGMGVIVDVVHNHYGPSDLGMWCFDGECLGAGGIYFFTDWRKSTPWGDTRPDYGRREVRDYILDNERMWLDEYRADGLRWDSTINIHGGIAAGWSLLQSMNADVNGRAPWKMMIAEDLQNNDWVTMSTSSGGAGFDAQWDAAFFHPVDDAIIAGDDSSRSMWAVKGAIEHAYNGSALQRVIYTESHDEVANGKERIPEMIWPGNAGSYYSRKRSTLGAAIALTSPGVPMLFMGQEFAESGYFADTHPLDWSKVDSNAGVLAMYKDLIALRRNFGGNTRGLQGGHVNVFHVNDSSKVIAYHRWQNGGAGDDVVVIANFSSQAFNAYDIGLPRGGLWHVRFNGDWSGYGADFGDTASSDLWARSESRDGLSYAGTVGVGPYSVVVLSQ